MMHGIDLLTLLQEQIFTTIGQSLHQALECMSPQKEQSKQFLAYFFTNF